MDNATIKTGDVQVMIEDLFLFEHLHVFAREHQGREFIEDKFIHYSGQISGRPEVEAEKVYQTILEYLKAANKGLGYAVEYQTPTYSSSLAGLKVISPEAAAAADTIWAYDGRVAKLRDGLTTYGLQLQHGNRQETRPIPGKLEEIENVVAAIERGAQINFVGDIWRRPGDRIGQSVTNGDLCQPKASLAPAAAEELLSLKPRIIAVREKLPSEEAMLNMPLTDRMVVRVPEILATKFGIGIVAATSLLNEPTRERIKQINDRRPAVG